MSNITLSKGLQISLEVLERLKKIKLNKHVAVGTFTNCRECGFTFMIWESGKEPFTWSVYEHRNSDCIIINGKEGYINLNGDLPYQGDKYQYLAEFRYGEYDECANKLAEFINNY